MSFRSSKNFYFAGITTAFCDSSATTEITETTFEKATFTSQKFDLLGKEWKYSFNDLTKRLYIINGKKVLKQNRFTENYLFEIGGICVLFLFSMTLFEFLSTTTWTRFIPSYFLFNSNRLCFSLRRF